MEDQVELAQESGASSSESNGNDLQPKKTVLTGRLGDRNEFGEKTGTRLEQKTAEARDVLENMEGFEDFLEFYDEVIESSGEVLGVVEKAFSELSGAELVSIVAQENLQKQARYLMIAASEILVGGRSTVSLFGRYVTFTDFGEVIDQLVKIENDFLAISALEPTFDEFNKRGLQIVDKYLFDGRNLERVVDTPVSILVLKDYEDKQGADQLASNISDMAGGNFEEKTFGDDYHAYGNVVTAPIPSLSDWYSVKKEVSKIEEGVFEDAGNWSEGSPLPDVVVIHVPDENTLRYQFGKYNSMYVDYWMGLDAEERPLVVFYTDGFKPSLADVSFLDGFLFASDEDSLRNQIMLAKELKSQGSGDDLMESTVLAAVHEKLYDNSDLRKWEHETANTYESLKSLVELIGEREAGLRGDFGYMNKVHNAVDFGSGEGRISNMLAILGIYVTMMDISNRQLEASKQRLGEEVGGLKGESGDTRLSYVDLLRLVEEGSVSESDFVLDERRLEELIIRVKGDFGSLHPELNRMIDNLIGEDWPKVMGMFRINPYGADNPFTTPMNYFLDVGYDLATFDWNTFCEAGGYKQEIEVVRNVANILSRGGLLRIEVPDRLVGPHARALNEYHRTHPEETFGTIRDETSVETGKAMEVETESATPRFFPGRNELVLILQSQGLLVDPEKDVRTYLIVKEDDQGRMHLQGKELVVIAQRPWR